VIYALLFADSVRAAARTVLEVAALSRHIRLAKDLAAALGLEVVIIGAAAPIAENAAFSILKSPSKVAAMSTRSPDPWLFAHILFDGLLGIFQAFPIFAPIGASKQVAAPSLGSLRTLEAIAAIGTLEHAADMPGFVVALGHAVLKGSEHVTAAAHAFGGIRAMPLFGVKVPVEFGLRVADALRRGADLAHHLPVLFFGN